MEFDFGKFLKDSSVADLDWLDVDEAQYRELDNLPKQNLDIQPDLEALWNREGESATKYLVPNVGTIPTQGIKNPHTMGDMSALHGNLRGQAEEIRKVARLALMQSTDTTRLRNELVKRFDLETLRGNRTVLAEVLQERGLLGKLYVAASDFSTCAQGGQPADFVRRYANGARYVLAKTACGDCRHSKTSTTGAQHCGVFHKEIQLEVPYSDALADVVERAQKGQGREVLASEGIDPKERIRSAYLATTAARVTDAYQGLGVSKTKPVAATAAEVKDQLISASSLLRKKQAEVEVQPVLAFLHREMVKGHTHEELVRTLKLAFSEDLLVRTRDQWQPLFRESGLYGVVYTKQASFDDCHKGADFLAKHNPSVRAIVAGAKCGSCFYNKAARCLMYGKSLVKNASEVITSETVEAVLLEHRTAGRLQSWDTKTASAWGDTPAKALRAIHAAAQQAPTPQVAPVRMGFMQGFYGQKVEHSTSDFTRRDIVKQASKYLNEGLYGQDLLTALKTRFEVRDIKAAADVLRPVVAEQGLQGIYYVDPSVYDDYGRGCHEASRLHRSRLVGYVKQGSKCESCVHQTKRGFCSVINKELVDEPPYVDKMAQQREILASGQSTEVTTASLIHSAPNMLAEFQMQQPLEVDIREAATPEVTAIQFGTGKVRL